MDPFLLLNLNYDCFVNQCVYHRPMLLYYVTQTKNVHKRQAIAPDLYSPEYLSTVRLNIPDICNKF